MRFRLVLFFLVCSFVLSAQSKKEIVHVIKELDHALKVHDLSLVREYFAEDFSLSTRMMPGAESMLRMIFADTTVIYCPDINTLKIKKHKEGAEANIVFHNSRGKKYHGPIMFDKNNRIRFIDYFDKLYGNSRYEQSELKAIIPFELENNAIILRLHLNNYPRPLRFMFDSGADGMAIGPELADSVGLIRTREQNTEVVGGTLAVSISEGNQVHLTDSISLYRQSIAIFDNFSKEKDGLIGLNLAENYILKFDFQNNLLELYSFGNYVFDKKGETLDIKNPYTIVLLPGELNLTGTTPVSGNFVMDTGAAYHLICFNRFVRKNRLLLSGFKPEHQGTTISMGHVTPTYHGKANSFKFGKSITLEDMPVSLQASTGAAEDNERIPDGSIGIGILSNYNLTIDLLRKKINLAPVLK